MTDEEKQKWLEGAEEFGSALENRTLVPVMQEDEIDYTVSMPAVKFDKDPSQYSSAKPQEYRQVPFKTFWNKILEGYQMSVDATADLTTIKTATIAAKDAAITAATGAENVDAALVGMTVTITNRQGVSHSVDIGFDIYRTYTSIAAMNADAANVPQGKFVIIATTDPTSADNAKMYCKNSQGSFTFLCDLDQASSAAWADWLNNMKPAIQSATDAANQAAGRVDTVIATANQDHTRAEADHTTAGQDHTQAGTDHSNALAATNNANTQANRAKAWADHPPYIGDGTTGDANFWYLWSEASAAYIKGPYAKGDDLDYSTMTQEEIQMLIDNIKADLIFASEQTCRDIISELT